MAASPTIVVVDDAPDVRNLLKTRLRLSDRLEVVGEGADGFDAVELARQHHPSLMLLDVSMPGRDGLAALPLVLEVSPSTRVVMFSGFDAAGLAEHTRRLGATAFLEKSVPLDELIERLVGLASPGGPGGPGGSAREEPDRAAVPLDSVLADHLERFREIFDDAAIGMATLTLDGRVVRVNRHLSHLLGDPPEALVGTPYAEIATGAEVDRALARLRGGGTAVQVEHGVVGRPDLRFQMTASAVLDAMERPLYFFLQVQDVTGQRVAEQALSRTEQRLRLLVEAVQDYAIFMLDPDGRIVSWNPGAERSKGYTADEIIGQHFRVFYPRDKQDEKHPEHELEIATREGRYEEEGWRIRKDGSRFWAHVTITAVHDDAGELVGFAKVTRDSTERRRMLSLLEHANEQLRLAAEEQSEFLAVTAHELRSPVGVLASSATLLANRYEDLTPEERTELAEGVNRNVDQVRRLLDDLLTASRAHTRTLDLRPVELSVDEQLDGLVAAFRNARPGFEVVLRSVPGLVAYADAGRFGQMVDNLLLNALRHGQAPVTVVARPDGSQVVVEVSDAGPGVPSQVLPRLFQRFGTSTGGTGLGLYIVRELALAHGGTAEYHADQNTFVIRLPSEGGAS
ncbi:PAS domain S-box protein [Nocardioides sp.]|uniref:PAS domain S-box protein n=1 Tax=Nocardioides sp. TaxID=35761 RepID=UPI002D810035|nr:PAS domain S-box protein [Nocardioides sp.]HET8959298.1 PAS domain S-box protein [Nocardioides sp.]